MNKCLLEERISIPQIIQHIKFSIFVVIILIFLCDFAYDSAGISGGYDIVGKVLCHDASGADHYVISNFYAGHDYGVSANPYIVAYGDGDAVFIARVSCIRVNGMPGGVYGNVGRNLGIFANDDLAYIQHSEIVIGKEVFSHFNIASVVAVKRGVDEYIFSCFPQNIFQGSGNLA